MAVRCAVHSPEGTAWHTSNRFDRNGEFFLQGTDAPEHFDSASAVRPYPLLISMDPVPLRMACCDLRIGEHLRFGHGLQRAGGIQDSPAFFSDFLVALAFKAAQKLPDGLAKRGGSGCHTTQAAGLSTSQSTTSSPLQSAMPGKSSMGPKSTMTPFQWPTKPAPTPEGMLLPPFRYGGASLPPTNPLMFFQSIAWPQGSNPARVP